MDSIYKFLEEINQNNSTNYKLEVLKKYKNSKWIKKLLQLTYDKVKYNYYISPNRVYEVEDNSSSLVYISLEGLFKFLEEELNTRKVTGNEALHKLSILLTNCDKKDREIILKILDRDLKINIGATLINKVWKGLITKPPYMRCSILSEKTIKKITFPAFLQEKCDGSYRSIKVNQGKVEILSRSGEKSTLPLLEKEFSKLKDGVYIGELLVNGIEDRAKANGLINSDNPPHNDIYIKLWDYITLDEWYRAKDSKNKTIYSERFDKLLCNINENNFIKIVETKVVYNLKQAGEITSKWMKEGWEGSILKDWNNIFKDHTSPTQIKLKVAFEVDVEITGFVDGKKGTKREKTFGAISFKSSDGLVQGQTSGFTDRQLEEFNKIRKDLIGKIMTVEANDLTKAKDKDYYALSHPRFIEIRWDKLEADNLERIKESLESGKNFDKFMNLS